MFIDGAGEGSGEEGGVVVKRPTTRMTLDLGSHNGSVVAKVVRGDDDDARLFVFEIETDRV
jgi:hypothetical protein